MSTGAAGQVVQGVVGSRNHQLLPPARGGPPAVPCEAETGVSRVRLGVRRPLAHRSDPGHVGHAQQAQEDRPAQAACPGGGEKRSSVGAAHPDEAGSPARSDLEPVSVSALQRLGEVGGAGHHSAGLFGSVLVVRDPVEENGPSDARTERVAELLRHVAECLLQGDEPGCLRRLVAVGKSSAGLSEPGDDLQHGRCVVAADQAVPPPQPRGDGLGPGIVLRVGGMQVQNDTQQVQGAGGPAGRVSERVLRWLRPKPAPVGGGQAERVHHPHLRAQLRGTLRTPVREDLPPAARAVADGGRQGVRGFAEPGDIGGVEDRRQRVLLDRELGQQGGGAVLRDGQRQFGGE